MRTGRGLVVVAALVAVVATGCLRADVDVRVEGDGSGTVAVEIYPGDDLARVVGEGKPLDLERLAKTATAGVDGAEVSRVSDGGDDGVRIEVPFDSYHELSQAATEQTVDGRGIQLFEQFAVTERSGDTWSLRARVDPSAIAGQAATLGSTLGGADAVGGDATISFSVTLPGKVTSSNADEESGGTATWKLDGARARDLTMDTEPSGLSLVAIALIGCGALLLVGAVLVLASRGRTGTKRAARRRRSEEAPAVRPPASPWGADAVPGGPTGPQQWTSPPPYSSHPVGAPAPVDVPASSGPDGAPPLPPLAPVGPPTAPPAMPPITAPPQPPPRPAPAAPPADAVGLPVLPAGFIPTPTTAFPETHAPGPPPSAVPPPYVPPPYVPPSDATAAGQTVPPEGQVPPERPASPSDEREDEQPQ
jgi:hypothetical protein